MELPPDDVFTSPGSNIYPTSTTGGIAITSTNPLYSRYSQPKDDYDYEQEQQTQMALRKARDIIGTYSNPVNNNTLRNNVSTNTNSKTNLASPPPSSSSSYFLPTQTTNMNSSSTTNTSLEAIANKPYLYTPSSLSSPPLPPTIGISSSSSLSTNTTTTVGMNDMNNSSFSSTYPNTVITANGVIVTGEASDAGRVALKVQHQAVQLTDLMLKLRDCEESKMLVEQRLLEIVPNHRIPVTRDSLGTNVEKLSSLTMSAAQTLVGTITPSKINGVPSHVVATTAASRKEALEQANTIRNLEKELSKDRKRLNDAVTRIKELKMAVDAKEKDRANALRRAEGLQHRIISLEAEMRLAGLKPIETNFNVDIVSTNKDAILSSNSTVGIGHHPPATMEELNATIEILKEELLQTRNARDHAQDRLSNEAKEGEKLRAQIRALENSIHTSIAATVSGDDKNIVSADKAHLVTQIARLQGEIEARVRDSNNKDSAIRDIQAQLRETQQLVNNLQGQLSEARAYKSTGSNNNVRTTNPLATPSRHPSSAASNVGGAIIRSPVLGEISSTSHINNHNTNTPKPVLPNSPLPVPGLPPGVLLPQPVVDVLARLESEKNALLDYVGELRDAVTTIAAEKTDLANNRIELQTQLSRARSDIDMHSRAAMVAEQEANRLSKTLLETQTRLAEENAKYATLSTDYARVTQDFAIAVETRDELTGVREILIEKIRELTRENDNARKETQAVRDKLADTERKLDSTEALMEQVENERDSADQRVREQRAQLEHAQESVTNLMGQLDSARAELEKIRGEKGTAEGRVRTLERRVEQLETIKAAEEQALKEAEIKAGRASLETEALSRTANAVMEAESAIAKYLRAHVGEAVGIGAEDEDNKLVDTEDDDELTNYDDQTDDVEVFDGVSGKAMVSPGRKHTNRFVSKIKNTKTRFSEGKGNRTNGQEDDTPAFKQVQAAAVAGMRARERAEGALIWATDAHINAAVPQVAAAARQLAGWLRLSGISLSDISRRMSQELEDRRLHRRTLYEEIHSLRETLGDSQDELRREKQRALDAETKVFNLSRQLETETTRLTYRLNEITEDRDTLKIRVEKITTALDSAQTEALKATTRAETLNAQLQTLSAANERLATQVDKYSSELNGAVRERDSLLDQLHSSQQTLDEVRSHNSVLTLEKKAAAETRITLEGQIKDAHNELRSLNERLNSTQRECASAIARAENANSTLNGKLEELTTLQSKYEDQVAAAADGAELANAQNEVISRYLVQLRAAQEQCAALNRGMAGISVELESAKSSLEASNNEYSTKVDAFVNVLRRVGVDVPVNGNGIVSSNTNSINPSNMSATAVAAAQFRALADSASSSSKSGNTSTVPSADSNEGFSQVAPLINKYKQLFVTLLTAGSSASQRITLLLAEIASLKNDIAAMKPRVEAVNEVVHSVQDKQRALAAAEASNADLRSALAAAESQLVSAQTEITALRNRINEQGGELERAGTRIAMLISDAEAFRDNERRAQALLVDANHQIHELKDEIQRMRTDADSLVSQRARAEANTQREVTRLNELSTELVTTNHQKTRAEQGLIRANETIAALRGEIIDLRSQSNMLTAKVSELQAVVAEREAELGAQKTHLRQMASMQAELEHRVAHDLQTLSSETAEAVTNRHQLVEQLAVKNAELEANKAELNALRTTLHTSGTITSSSNNSGSSLRSSTSSRAPSPLPSYTNIGSTTNTAGMDRYTIASLPMVPLPMGNSSSTSSSTAKTGIDALPPLPSMNGIFTTSRLNSSTIGSSTGSSSNAVSGSSLNTLASPKPTVNKSSSSGSAVDSPGTALLQERLAATRARFESLKKSSVNNNG